MQMKYGFYQPKMWHGRLEVKKRRFLFCVRSFGKGCTLDPLGVGTDD